MVAVQAGIGRGRWLAGNRNVVGLQRAQPDDVDVLSQGPGRRVPDESIHAVAEQLDVGGDIGIDAGAALGPADEHLWRGGKIRVQGHGEQPALGRRVHREVEHEIGLDHPVDDALHLPGGLLENQEIVFAQEHDPNRLHDPRVEHRRDLKSRIQERRRSRVGERSYARDCAGGQNGRKANAISHLHTSSRMATRARGCDLQRRLLRPRCRLVQRFDDPHTSRFLFA